VLERLREAAEKAKIELSQSMESQINLPYITHSEQGPLHLDTKLTRAEFQRMTSDLLDRCKAPFKQVIKDASVKLSDIQHVVLVGGSTRMPAVVDVVKELTGGKDRNQLASRDVRAFPGRDGLHKYPGPARYRAAEARDGRNADDLITQPNKRAPTRLTCIGR